MVLWTDPGGYDAYRTERRFAPWEKASFAATTQEVKQIDSPARYNIRFAPTTRPYGSPGQPLTPEQFEEREVGPKRSNSRNRLCNRTRRAA